jgi:very-short-patch-repair endonuclease
MGISDHRLHGPHWHRLSYGLFMPRSPAEQFSLVRRCAALTKVLPAGAVIAGLTAASLYDLWLPRLPDWLPALAALPPGEDRPERDGMYVFRSRAGHPAPCTVEGVPVVPPEVCIGQLAEDLRLVDLVIAIDSALHARLCTLGDITDAIRSRQRGLPMLREALPLCDGRSESPWESVLRLLLAISGIDVDVQPDIRDEAGRFVARADLLIRGTRRLAEYDGGGHRERAQHEADLVRDKSLARNGWQRYGYTSREILLTPGRIVRDAEDALGIPARPERIGDWLQVASESSLGREGRSRLTWRLHRFDRPLRGRKPPRGRKPSYP